MPTSGETSRRALVTGVTGQDGSFLIELLLEKGYAVTGWTRRGRGEGLGASQHMQDRIELIRGDLLDPESITAAVTEVLPDELYHLAAPSQVLESWRHPAWTLSAIAGATATLLEAVRDHSPTTRVFVAVSGTMFGAAPESPQREDTPCRPLHPYAIAKLAAHELTGRLRDHDGLFACSGILYNHESERRPESFVTRKIARGVAEISLGLRDHLELGDLDAVRDWSFAGDVMHGAWLALQQDSPEDFILASGAPRRVEELAHIAFAHVGLRAADHIRLDPALRRPADPTPLVGEPARAKGKLGWRPTVSFEELIHRMVDADLSRCREEAAQGREH